MTVSGDTNVSCRVSLIDKDEYYAAFNVDHSANFSGVLKIVSPKLWWPYLMDPEPGYLYTFQVSKPLWSVFLQWKYFDYLEQVLTKEPQA